VSFDITNKKAQRAFEAKAIAEAEAKAARVAVAEAKLEVDRKAAAEAAQRKADEDLRESVKRCYLSNPAADELTFEKAWRNGLREKVLEQQALDRMASGGVVHSLYKSL
jgi:membrane protein involved in colicin uptake